MAKTNLSPTQPKQTAQAMTNRIRDNFRGVLWHGGKKYRAGDTLDVSADDIERYGYQQILEKVETSQLSPEPES